jgi:hypothetical protein
MPRSTRFLRDIPSWLASNRFRTGSLTTEQEGSSKARDWRPLDGALKISHRPVLKVKCLGIGNRYCTTSYKTTFLICTTGPRAAICDVDAFIGVRKKSSDSRADADSSRQSEWLPQVPYFAWRVGARSCSVRPRTGHLCPCETGKGLAVGRIQSHIVTSRYLDNSLFIGVTIHSSLT